MMGLRLITKFYKRGLNNMDKSKADLLNQLRTMSDYVDQNYEDIVEKDARSAMQTIHGAWRFLERRKGVARG